jgi:hypothetical protein
VLSLPDEWDDGHGHGSSLSKVEVENIKTIKFTIKGNTVLGEISGNELNLPAEWTSHEGHAHSSTLTKNE